jgi:hypothetical protein
MGRSTRVCCRVVGTAVVPCGAAGTGGVVAGGSASGGTVTGGRGAVVPLGTAAVTVAVFVSGSPSRTGTSSSGDTGSSARMENVRGAVADEVVNWRIPYPFSSVVTFA